MSQTVESVFADQSDGRWYRSLLAQFPAQSECELMKSAYLVDNRTKPFLERYFQTVFLPDVGGKPYNDMCLLRHSNRLFVVGLAPGHSVFQGCYADQNNYIPQPHTLIGIDYQVNPRVNRMDNVVRGKKKTGGQILNTPMDAIGYALCDRGVRHRIVCGVPGRLIEINASLSVNPQPQKIDSGASRKKRTTVLLPPDHPVPLQALGDPRAGWEFSAGGSFLCIVSPCMGRLKAITQQLKLRKLSETHTHSAKTSNAATGDKEASDQDEDQDPGSDRSEPDDVDVVKDGQDPQDWIPFISQLTKQCVLTWDEYAKLRDLR